jgi:hypothetical protein
LLSAPAPTPQKNGDHNIDPRFLLTSPSPDGDPNSVSLKRAADSIEDSAPKKIRPEAEATFADSAATDDSWRWSSAESEGSPRLLAWTGLGTEGHS